MIHQVQLSEITCARLTDIVMLQMHLLLYAAFTPNFDEISCQTYLENCPGFQGRGEKIVRWIWNAPVNRRGKLECFARYYESRDTNTQIYEQQCKQIWAKRLFHEALVLSNNQNILIEETYSEETATLWQKAGAEFLINFYNDLCSDAKLPSCLFNGAGTQAFGRQEFLEEFKHANPNLHVCAVCDESAFYTTLNGVIYTDIDHYFPKSLYPHFSCHPYNLVPICLLCNQRIKEKKDPLARNKGQRRTLHEIFLPYRERTGLGQDTYLKVRFGKGQQNEECLYLEELVPYFEDAFEAQREDVLTVTDDSMYTRKNLEALAEIYGVPQRWDPDKIAETLFRRMRQFLQGNESIFINDSTLKDDAQIVLTGVLDQLLYCFQNQEEGDRGKDPLTIAMASLLATLINDEIEATSSSLDNSALMQEIVCWFGENSADNIKRVQQARRLREIMKKRELLLNGRMIEQKLV